MTVTWIRRTEATRLKVSTTGLRGVRRGVERLFGLAYPCCMCYDCSSECKRQSRALRLCSGTKYLRKEGRKESLSVTLVDGGCSSFIASREKGGRSLSIMPLVGDLLYCCRRKGFVRSATLGRDVESSSKGRKWKG